MILRHYRLDMKQTLVRGQENGTVLPSEIQTTL